MSRTAVAHRVTLDADPPREIVGDLVGGLETHARPADPGEEELGDGTRVVGRSAHQPIYDPGRERTGCDAEPSGAFATAKPAPSGMCPAEARRERVSAPAVRTPASPLAATLALRCG